MLLLRVVTALVLAPLFLGAVFLLPNEGFALFIGLFLLLAGWEWASLCALSGAGRVVYVAVLAALALAIGLLGVQLPVILLGCLFWVLATGAVIAFPRGRGIWALGWARMLAGPLMMLPAVAGLVMLQARAGGGWLVVWTMLMVWGADIGAYFAGHAFGRHKLAPDVSPGKTVEGALGGALAAILLSAGMGQAAGLDAGAWPWLALATLLMVAVSIIGDLTESMIKRVAGVKDSGTLLPGHGGVLDRVDAVLAAVPVGALLIHLADVVPGGLLG